MTQVFLINPKATQDDIGRAISDRLTQARAVCQFAINSSLSGSGDFVQSTFWAVDSLINDANRLNDELDERAIKEAGKNT